MLFKGIAMQSRSILTIAAALGGLSVALGAFGSHALRGIFDPYQMQTFEVAVKYQMFHALALGLVSVLSQSELTNHLKRAAYFFSIGTFLFSGSLYLLLGTGIKMFGAVTPLGGVSLMIGWVCLVREGLSRPV
jgi:uncharacterized membrane protein YgdD (TMEM256/DUF423 family)